MQFDLYLYYYYYARFDLKAYVHLHLGQLYMREAHLYSS